MYSSDDDDNLNFEYDDVAEQQLQPHVKMWENLCIEEKIRYYNNNLIFLLKPM